MCRSRSGALLAIAIVCIVALSCGDDPVEFVTVAGIVRNVDTGVAAPGVRVSLYGTNHADVVATGTDGAYSLRVPLGSKLWLFTDDFDSANDVWFPLVNVDRVPVFAHQDVPDFPIHCCPTAPAQGSVAAWDNFLQNSDDANGNRFVPTVSTQSGGIITLAFVEGINHMRVLPNVDSMSVVSNSPFFPAGFARIDKFFSMTGPDPSLGPDILHPSSQAFTDPSGMFFSFGDPANTAGTITFQVTDASGRLAPFASTFELPVARGMISLAVSGTMDGVLSEGFREFGCWANLFTCTP